jgi:hypothetical protein
MTEPRRMLDGAGDELEMDLLRSAAHDGPSDGARRKAMATLGLGAATAATALTTAAEASLPPVAKAASASTSAVLVKWIGLAVIAGAVGWGVFEASSPQPVDPLASAMAPDAADIAVADEGAASDVPVDAASDVPSHKPGHKPGDRPGALEEAAAQTTATQPVATGPAAPEPAVPSTATAVAAPPSNTLADEVAALDRARRAMDDDPEQALAALDAYRDKHANGVLAQEAQVLRIESLSRAGKHDAARASAATFLAKHPSSPLAGRVRTVLATTPGE